MFTKNNSEPKLKTICVDMDPVQLAKMTPAVTFAAPNITTLSGESVSNGEIYDTFVKLNGKCVNTVMNALGSGADPRFAAAAIDIASKNIFNNIVDSFMNAICNQYAVYLNRVNLIIINIFDRIKDKIFESIPIICKLVFPIYDILHYLMNSYNIFIFAFFF